MCSGWVTLCSVIWIAVALRTPCYQNLCQALRLVSGYERPWWAVAGFSFAFYIFRIVPAVLLSVQPL